ncbi:MAG: ComEC/Rec2 family competence protein [Pseudomonadota bacterium]
MNRFDGFCVEPAVVYHIAAKRQGSAVGDNSQESEAPGLKPNPQAESQPVVRPNHPLLQSDAKLPLRTRIGLWAEFHGENLKDRLSAAARYEAETGLGFVLIPVWLGLGIVLYFAAPAEPLWAVVILAAALLLALGQMQSRAIGHALLFATTFTIAGMSAAKISAQLKDTPIIERQITGIIIGTVLEVERNRRGAPRYLLKPHRIEGVETGALPRRIRVSSASRQITHPPRTVLKGLARMQPVSGPVYPGGYDFGFFARFEGLGGSGFFMGAPSATEQTFPLGIKDCFLISINSLRHAISRRIETALPGDEGKVATALLTGDKTGIPDDIQDSLRATGLAHILAISGLHMALVTLTVIWMARLALVARPATVFRHNTKKWAALAGFLFATFYLFISGWGVATQRAWIMITVMLCAVMVDRRAITMRSVAISAILILLFFPESLLSPGFQMSFAAVASLVAVYEVLNRWRQDRRERTHFVPDENRYYAVSTAAKYMGGLALTSLVAGTATGFVAAWHFHQVPVLGLLANILAMPIVSLVVMPGVLGSLLLLPFGYEFVALAPVGEGISSIVSISNWVQSFGSVAITGKLANLLLALFATGLACLTLMKSRLRLIGLFPFALIPLFHEKAPIPDVIIAEHGRTIAVKSENGKLAVLIPKRENFVTEVWGKAYDGGTLERVEVSPQLCDKERCIHKLLSGLVLHIVYDPDLLKSSCNSADILVAPRLRWVNCRETIPRLILKRGDFEQHGSHAIFAANPGASQHALDVITALPEPNRPWQRHVSDYETQ